MCDHAALQDQSLLFSEAHAGFHFEGMVVEVENVLEQVGGSVLYANRIVAPSVVVR